MTMIFIAGIAGVIIFVLFLLIISFTIIYNNIQNYIIRINEAEANIDSVLRKRFDLLNKSIDIIKVHAKTDEVIMDNIIKLRSKKISNFELDRQLYDGINEFNKYKELYPELNQSEAFAKIDIDLNESEAEITAFRKYYNDIITDYNKLVRSFPAIILALFCKCKKKTYFDGKNMDDDDIKDFKL